MIRKWTLAAVAAAAVAGLVAGCAPGGSAPTSSTTSGSGNAKHLTVWTSLSGVQLSELQSYTKAFNTAHSGDTVSVVAMADADLKQKVQAGLVAKNLPDIIEWYGGSFLSPVVSAGALANLNPEIAASSSWKSDFDPGAFTNYTVKGDVYAVPYDAPVVELFYNKSVLARAGISQPPTTFSDLLADVSKLKSHGVIPITLDGQDGYPLQEWYTYLAMRDGGANLINDAMSGKTAWTAAPFEQAATQLQQLIKAGGFQQGFLGTSYDAAYANYYGQRAGFILSGTWILSELALPANKNVLASTGFVPFPTVAGGTGTTSEAQGGPNDAFGITSNAGNKKLAWEWLEGLTQTPETTKMAQQSLDLPPNKIPTSSSVPALYSQVLTALSGYNAFNLFWNEILPPAQNTEFTNLMNNMAAGEVTPGQFMSKFAAYMKSQTGSSSS